MTASSPIPEALDRRPAQADVTLLEGLSPDMLPTKERMLADASALPSPPLVVLELLQLLNDEDVSLAALADLVSKDGALAAELLRTVNSVVFGLSSRVSRIDRAISTLGLRAFRSLLAKRSMQELVPDGDGAVAGEIRRRCIVNATLARAFATEIDENVAEEAFLVGLLGSIGHLAFARVAPEVYAILSDADHGWLREGTEREVLGFSSDDITSELMQRWCMPDVVTEAIRLRGPSVRHLVPRHASPKLIISLSLAQKAEHVLCGDTPSADLADLMTEVRKVIGIDMVRLSEILIANEALVIELAHDLTFEAPAVGSHAERVQSAVEEIGEGAETETA